MDAKKILEDIKKKSQETISMALRKAKKEGTLKDEDVQKIYDASVKISDSVVKEIESVDDRDEIVIATAMSLVSLISDTVKIYMEDNRINIEGEEQCKDAPESMYL